MSYSKKKIKNILYKASKGRFPQNPMTIIVSYPKCGRTWLRVLVGKAICEKYKISEKLLLESYKISKGIGFPFEFSHQEAEYRNMFSFDKIKISKKQYLDKKIIFLIRDPRDVVVSSYFQAVKREKRFKGSISEFIRNEHFGVKKVISFYKIWDKYKSIPMDFMVLRYEEMHTDPAFVLKKTLKFLNLRNIDDRIIKNAVDFASFQNMKEMEKSKAYKSDILSPGDLNDKESYKVRKGLVGNYKEYLTRDDLDYLEEEVTKSECPFCFVKKD